MFTHASSSTSTPMTFSVFLPPAALAPTCSAGSIPVIYWLSGLTCTWENFSTKGGAFAAAAVAGVAVVAPDTSPRGEGVAEGGSWSLGVGAGFYVDATEPRWRDHYRMATYVTEELPAVLAAGLPALAPLRRSIMGHSMGGLGAISLALRSPGSFKAVTAFAPIAHPSAGLWGRAAYSALLGADETAWAMYDPTALVTRYAGPPILIEIEQGGADEFLAKELLPQDFVTAAKSNGLVSVRYSEHAGYDHSYYFVSSFIERHIREHAALIKL